MTKETTDDKELGLIDRAQQGDNSALDELVSDLRRPLFSFIYRMVTHRENAEDLMQDTLVRVMQSLPQFRREAKFKTWLFGIATHVCLDHLRQKNRWSVDAQLKGERETSDNPGQWRG